MLYRTLGMWPCDLLLAAGWGRPPGPPRTPSYDTRRPGASRDAARSAARRGSIGAAGAALRFGGGNPVAWGWRR
jgi:hypothetical protein